MEGQLSTRARFVKLAALSERPLHENVLALKRCVRPLAVVMSHDYRNDRNVLAALLDTDVEYIGVLGPTQRTQRRLRELETEGVAISAAQRARVFGPAGLALGAETAAEIALSIVSEAQAVLARTSRGSLRDRPGHIHPTVAPVLHEVSA